MLLCLCASFSTAAVLDLQLGDGECDMTAGGEGGKEREREREECVGVESLCLSDGFPTTNCAITCKHGVDFGRAFHAASGICVEIEMNCQPQQCTTATTTVFYCLPVGGSLYRKTAQLFGGIVFGGR